MPARLPGCQAACLFHCCLCSAHAKLRGWWCTYKRAACAATRIYQLPALPICLGLQIHVQAVRFGGKFLETFFKSLPFWVAVYAEQQALFQGMVGGRWLPAAWLRAGVNRLPFGLWPLSHLFRQPVMPCIFPAPAQPQPLPHPALPHPTLPCPLPGLRCAAVLGATALRHLHTPCCQSCRHP